MLPNADKKKFFPNKAFVWYRSNFWFRMMQFLQVFTITREQAATKQYWLMNYMGGTFVRQAF